ncbi:MAG TPA: glycosyltransferase, partial [Firmicutes bacterium]|nr:glycosyltransferase [Bacillota bacterium]
MISVLEWIFWISFGLGFYVYFIYPAVLSLIALFIRHEKLPAEKFSDDNLPMVAHLVACFNEEKEIEGKIENCMSLDYPSDKILLLILDDGSADRTVGLAKKAIEAYPGRKVEIFQSAENKGKSGIIKLGVDWIKQNRPDVQVLVFSDANSRWEKTALRKLVEPYSQPSVAAVSGLLRYANPDGTAAGDME